MSFWKSFFAALLAIFVSSLTFFVFLIIAVCFVFAFFYSDESTPIQGNTVLTISLEGDLQDHAQDDIYNTILDKDVSPSLEAIVGAIKQAEKDSLVKGIFIKPGIISTGYGSLEEIRKAIEHFKEATGKPVIAYSGKYSQGNYYVASIADSIYLNPIGAVDFRGIATSSMFYKSLLDTLGVDMQVIKMGTYKSYGEKYDSDTMSAANREQKERLVNSLWGELKNDVSKSRNLSEEALDNIANSMLIYRTPQEVLETGLIDGLKYADEVESILKELIEVSEEEDVNYASVTDYWNGCYDNTEESSLATNEVAVLYAEGEIDNGSTSGLSSTKIIKQLNQLEKDTIVKAVVIRVNSPGGSAYGAEQMWHAITRLKAVKPVVVSMGDYAASGGYYMSVAANHIFTEKKTITGSIGVFCVIPNISKLIHKLGVHQEIVKTNANADLLSTLMHPLTDEEKIVLQSHVESVYNTFLDRVEAGRPNLKRSEIEELAEGRVWSGTDAHHYGLVDELGTLDDAIQFAAQEANLGTSYYVYTYPETEDWKTQIRKLPNIGYEKFKAFVLSPQMSSWEQELILRLQNLDHDQMIIPDEMMIR